MEEKINETIENEEVTTAEEKADGELNELFDENSVKAISAFKARSKIDDLKDTVKNIQDNGIKMLSEDVADVVVEKLDEFAKTHTEEEIKSLTKEELDELFTHEGKQIEFMLSFDSEEENIKFQKDYLNYRRESIESIAKFSDEIVKIEEEYAKTEAELGDLLKQYTSITNVVQTRLEYMSENAPTEEARERFSEYLKFFKHGFDLENIKTYCRSYKGKSIYGDYRFDKNSHKIYNKYKKMCKIIKIKSDLTTVVNFEAKALETDHSHTPNLFLFAVIHYISSLYNKTDELKYGIFLSQLTVNVKNLIYDKFDTEEDKEEFTKNVEEVLSILY